MTPVAARWLCLHFPRLALEVIGRRLADRRGFAVVASHGSQRWILDCDPESARLGVAPPMGLATAYALAPDLKVHPRDPPAEEAALTRLAGIAYAFSDRVSPCPPDGVLLEIGASLRLFGGLDPLCRNLHHEIELLGHQAGAAVAPTPTAARLLTRACRYQRVTELDPLPQVFADIPVECCEWPEAVASALKGVGAHTLQQAMALPRDGVARRFGREIIAYLDRLLGRRPEPLAPFRPPDRFQTRLELPSEVLDSDGLVFAARRMLDELGQFLRLRDGVVDRLEVTLHHAPPASPTGLSVGLVEPDRDPQRLTELLRERLRYLELPAPVREMELAIPETFGHRPITRDLFEVHRDQHDWSRVRERLQSRLGTDAIVEMKGYPDHRPEKAWQTGVAEERASWTVSMSACERPVWLLDPPRPLTEDTRLVSGPERIETGWWDGQDASRDYYIAEAASGSRLWVFKDRRQPDGWYVHGLFA